MIGLSRLLICLLMLLSAGICNAKVSEQILSKKQSIVTIYVEENHKTIAYGSGFVIDGDGLIVTNHHVIAPWEKTKGGELFIKRSDGKFLTPIEVVSTDKDKDVAIIRVKEKRLPFIKLAAEKPKQGEGVVVIGNPLGFETTVTDGIVSGVRGYDGLVQITAPISNGSSGSPVLNSNGDVIGIATILITNAQNLNFAIPVSYVESLLLKADGLKSSGKREVIIPKTLSPTIDEDLQVKMSKIPSESIRWGMSINELKKAIDSVVCESMKSGVFCDYMAPDFSEVSFFFENNKLDFITSMVVLPKSDPDKLNNELDAIEKATGMRPNVSENRSFFWTQLQFSKCDSKIKNLTDAQDILETTCVPGVYLSTYIKDRAKEPLKLLDLILGESTQEDIIEVCKKNNWQYKKSEIQKDIIILSNVKLEGIARIELNLMDNKLISITYLIDNSYKDKSSFHKLITNKYGKHTISDIPNSYSWNINTNTKDEVRIFMQFDTDPDNVKSITYTSSLLASKKSEIEFYNYLIEHNKSIELKSKAF